MTHAPSLAFALALAWLGWCGLESARQFSAALVEAARLGLE